jgi:hypothetical protein
VILHASPWGPQPPPGPQPAYGPPYGPPGAPVVRHWPVPPGAVVRAGPHRAWTTAPATLKVAQRAQALLRRQRKPAPRPGANRTMHLVAALGGGVSSYVLVRILLGRFAHPPRSKA